MKQKKVKKQSVVTEVIAVFHRAVKLAQWLGVTPQAITHWKNKGVIPKAYCTQIEKATGIPCERLNPTINWSYVRSATSIQN